MSLAAAAEPEGAEKLDDLGLSCTRPEERRVAEDVFMPLDHLGAYVVETPDPQMQRAARETLEPDYLIVPDVPLSIPRARLDEVRARRPRGTPYWPDPSGVPAAHAAGLTGAGVLVGVLDTGVDADHLELRDKRIDYRYVPLRPDEDPVRAVRGFDVEGHGTHVCGIIAGKNVGVAPGAELMAAAVIESETLRTSLERVVVALDWMLSAFQDPARQDMPTILNLSLGFREDWVAGADFQAAVEGMSLLLGTLDEDFEVLTIAAIGNDGPGSVRIPAALPETLSVGAVDGMRRPASFSGGGVSPAGTALPDLAGYGVDILSSLERAIDKHSRYANMSGTSMAAPYVAGIAALYAGADPSLQGDALRAKLLETVLPLDAPDIRVGAGLARWTEPGP